MGGSGQRMGGSGQVWSGRAAGGGRAGAMGTSGLCLKSCKRFGVKNARGENLWAKSDGVWAKNGGGSGQRMHFVVKKRIFVGKENCIMPPSPVPFIFC